MEVMSIDLNKLALDELIDLSYDVDASVNINDGKIIDVVEN